MHAINLVRFLVIFKRSTANTIRLLFLENHENNILLHNYALAKFSRLAGQLVVATKWVRTRIRDGYQIQLQMSGRLQRGFGLSDYN